MFLTDADPATDGRASTSADEPGGSAANALSAAIKAVVVTGSALALTCGIGVVVWAVTPSSGSGPAALLRAGVAAFAAANGMSVTIGRSALTLPPLLLTVVAIALLTTVSGRGRVVPQGRRQETLTVFVSSAVYALTVTVSAVVLSGHGVIRPDQWWRPAFLAVVVIGGSTLVRGDGWRAHLESQLPVWVPVAVRLAAVGAATVIGGGAFTVAIGLARALGDSATVQNLAAPGASGGLGMALLGLAFLPNAVMAGVGYSTGVGFTIGNGTYSMFGSSAVELPPITLLTAAPDGPNFARLSSLLLLFPVLAAVLMGRGAIRRLDSRRDRIFAVAVAAGLAAISLALVAAAASGGVAGGEWSTSGVPPLLLALVLVGFLGSIGSAVAGLARDEGAVAGLERDEVAGERAESTDTGDEPATEQDSAAQEQDLPEEVAEEQDLPEEVAEEQDLPEEVAEEQDLPEEVADEQSDAEAEVRRDEDLIADAESDSDARLVTDLARPDPARRAG